MGILDHFTCLLRHLYEGQETTVRTRHRVKNWFKIGKEVHQGCILSPCLFNLYAEQRDEAQARIKISMIVNNLRYVMAQPLWQKAKRN